MMSNNTQRDELDEIDKILLDFDLSDASPGLREALIPSALSSIEFQEAKQKLRDYIAREIVAVVGMDITADKRHACRFNDGRQNCKCFIDGRNELRQEIREEFTDRGWRIGDE